MLWHDHHCEVKRSVEVQKPALMMVPILSLCPFHRLHLQQTQAILTASLRTMTNHPLTTTQDGT